MQAEHLGHVQRWKAFAGLDDRFGQAASHASIAIQPTDSLHAFAAVTTADSPEQNTEAHGPAKDG
ncbi:hypothetical protein D3C71_2126010 [compost metagenome]